MHFALTKERQASTTQPPSPKYLLYTGKLYSPPFYFRFFRTRCKWVKLRRDKLQCLKSPLNTIVYGQIQDGANLFANKEGRKLNGAKITLYTVLPSTVFSIQWLFSVNFLVLDTKTLKTARKSIFHERNVIS